MPAGTLVIQAVKGMSVDPEGELKKEEKDKECCRGTPGLSLELMGCCTALEAREKCREVPMPQTGRAPLQERGASTRNRTSGQGLSLPERVIVVASGIQGFAMAGKKPIDL